MDDPVCTLYKYYWPTQSSYENILGLENPTIISIPHPRGPRGFQNYKSPTPGDPGVLRFLIPHPHGGGVYYIKSVFRKFKYNLLSKME